MDDLEALGIRRFGQLSKAETRLLSSAPKGEVAECGPSSLTGVPANDPAKADGWGPERVIRAELIRWLCTDQEAYTRVDARGLRIFAAKIVGKLDLSYATVPFAVRLDQCRLTDDVKLTYTKIPEVVLNGSRTRCLLAEGAEVKGNLLLKNGFFEGEVRLIGARIGDSLNCEGSTFSNTSGECSDPREEKTRGRAIRADRIKVEGGIFLRKGFKADGEVMLNGASVGGDLSCSGAILKNLQGSALSAENATVGGNVFLFDGFSAYGIVNLGVAKIGGALNCFGGAFDRVVLNTIVVKGIFVWSHIQNANVCQLDLRNAVVGSIADDEISWPKRGNLHLDGFEYGRITGTPGPDTFGEAISEKDITEIEKRLGGRRSKDSPKDARTRLMWLDRDVEFKLQPYRQLARVLHEMGDDEGEKQVLFEMESRARSQARRSLILFKPIQWTGDTISEVTVGYGLHPLWALWELGVLWGLGFILCRRAGAMAPKDEKAYDAQRKNSRLPDNYPPFSPTFYSLENCVPLIKFGQTDRWHPDPNPRPSVTSAPRAGRWAKVKTAATGRIWKPSVLRVLLWLMTIAGWVLATFCVAGLAGIIKRD